jgi:hypothetical protein
MRTSESRRHTKMDHSPTNSYSHWQELRKEGDLVARSSRAQQRTPRTPPMGTGGPRMPIFLVDGLSHGKDHPDLRNRVEGSCRGILPACTLEEDGGFLYLRKEETPGMARQAPTGDLVWIKSGLHASTLSMLDRFESPWRRRGKTTALPDGEAEGMPCWVYFPEKEAGRR